MVLANFELFVLFFVVDNVILIIDISFHSRIPHIITILIAERRPRFILVSCIAIYILHEPVSQRYTVESVVFHCAIWCHQRRLRNTLVCKRIIVGEKQNIGSELHSTSA